MARRRRGGGHGLGSRRHPPDHVVAQASGATVTGRFSQPSEVADLVLFLAGDQSRNITGSDFVIDGGFIPTW